MYYLRFEFDNNVRRTIRVSDLNKLKHFGRKHGFEPLTTISVSLNDPSMRILASTAWAFSKDICFVFIKLKDCERRWYEGDIDVDELTSGSIEIKVDAKTDNNSMEIRVLPSKVKIYYQVGLSDFQKVSEKMFEAKIVLPESGDLPEKLKVVLSKEPDFIKVKRIEPLFVEYLIIKK